MPGRISVIIPVYNNAPYLSEAIQSVLSQARRPHEIIVVDDGSTDDSVQVARKFEDAGVRVLSTRVNSGSAVARNVGIQEAKGEYVAMLDGDDIWLPHHLATVSELLDKNTAAALAFSLTEAFGGEHWTWPKEFPSNQPLTIFWEIAAGKIPPHTNILVRRRQLLEIGGYDPVFRVAQDYDLYLRLSYNWPFVCAHEITTRYRRHTSSITFRKDTRWRCYQYLSRAKFLAANRSALSTEEIHRFEQIAHSEWSKNIEHFWCRGDVDCARFHLAQRFLIPNSEAAAREWDRKLRSWALHAMWLHLPPGLRNRLRSIAANRSALLRRPKQSSDLKPAHSTT